MRFISVLLTGIITSFFFFSFEFRFLPGINTKMMLAVLGLVFFVFHSINKKTGAISKDLFIVSIIASIFSFISFYAVVYNNTDDYSDVAYVVSMWVWFFAAYATCYIINHVHSGNLSLKLVVDYLICISIFQCIIALMIDFIPPLKTFVDTYIDMDIEIMDRIHRIYGIGASLDVAGGKFAAVLLMIAVVMCNNDTIRQNWKSVFIYSFSFILISILGPMIARTTYIGTFLGLAYIIYRTEIWNWRIKYSNLKLWRVLIGVLCVLVVACIYFYNHSPGFREWFRFGFEGFVNLIERGRRETGATEILQSMMIFPESLKTWIIGDGLTWVAGGYYMRTDIGFLRFIFYCGIIGLISFTSMFIYLSVSCYKKFPQEKHLFLLLLVLVFAIWAKVTTDIFLVYALFMCIPMLQQHDNNLMSET